MGIIPVASLGVVFLSLCVDIRRIERAGPHTPSALLNSTCQLISNSPLGSSAMYAPGTCKYRRHGCAARVLPAFGVSAHMPYSKGRWARSLIEYSACSVEPGNVQDLSIVVHTLSIAVIAPVGRSTLVPFPDEGP